MKTSRRERGPATTTTSRWYTNADDSSIIVKGFETEMSVSSAYNMSLAIKPKKKADNVKKTSVMMVCTTVSNISLTTSGLPYV